MDRRHFLLYTATTATAATLTCTAQAIDNSSLPAKNLIFSQDNGGIWEAKKDSHVPSIEVDNDRVTVSTDHGHSKTHYIVRHTLLLADGTVVGAKTFSPLDEPISEHKLPTGYNGTIYATSFCNKHDLWLAKASI
jgi:superoxide reductase